MASPGTPGVPPSARRYRGEGWIRLALYALPQAFRAAYGEEMIEFIRAELGRARGRRGAARVGCHAVVDLLRVAVRLRLRSVVAVSRGWRPDAEALVQDLRLALRRMAKDRVFATTAIVTLALCIAGNTATFTVVRSVLLRPLDVAAAERLVYIYDSYPGMGVERTPGGPVPFYYDLREQTDVFTELALYRSFDRNVGGGSAPSRERVMRVTPSFFHLLDRDAALGRVFTDDEGELGNTQRIILSHGLWQQRFGGDPDVIGRDLELDGQRHEIVGIMPAGFAFLEPDVRLWTPLAFNERQRAPVERHRNRWELVARLKDGATIAQAQEQIDAVNARAIAAHAEPDALRTALENAGFQTFVVPLQEDLVRTVRAVLYLLEGGALFVLLIGAVNIANLVLVRTSVQRRELATRHILGASRWRLARQLVTETTLLAVAGGVLGLVAGRWGLELMATVGLDWLPRGHEIRMDTTVVVAMLGITGLIGVAVGSLPVGAVTRQRLAIAIQSGGRTGTASRGARRARQALVTAQVSIACVLLAGAGLLLASFQRILAVDPGFSSDGIISGSVSLSSTSYRDADARRSFVARSLAAIRALPGVTAAGLTSAIPFGSNHSSQVILAADRPMAADESLISPSRIEASGGYFAALGIPLLKGRLFDERDTAEAPPVVVIDQRLARHFWGEEEPIGRALHFSKNPDQRITVVGVVGTIRDRGLVDADDRPGAYYFPLAQRPYTFRGLLSYAIRTAGDPRQLLPAVRRALAEIDPELPLFDVMTLDERVDSSLAPRRTPMVLAVAFGGVALLLAAIGIYGILAYQVTQRRREIGVRMALGSSGRRIFLLILNQGLAVVGLGLAAGLAGIVALRRLLAAQLYGVESLDPQVLAAALGVLGLVALAACLTPARRASRIDPIVTLRDR